MIQNVWTKYAKDKVRGNINIDDLTTVKDKVRGNTNIDDLTTVKDKVRGNINIDDLTTAILMLPLTLSFKSSSSFTVVKSSVASSICLSTFSISKNRFDLIWFDLQSRARTHAVLVIGLYELLGNA
jgi:hypothetical protein